MGNLHVAIQENDKQTVQRVVKDHPEQLKDINEYGMTPLLYALYKGKRDLAKIMYDAKTTFSIHERIGMGDVSSVQDMLINRPESVMEFSRDGWTPLHLAAYWGRRELVKLLLEYGASVDRPSLSEASFGNSPLQAAISQGREDIVHLLLESGANACFVQEPGKITPLHIAASRDNPNIVEMLLKKGADPSAHNAELMTPLDVAIERNNIAVEQLLRAYGAVTFKEKGGQNT